MAENKDNKTKLNLNANDFANQRQLYLSKRLNQPKQSTLASHFDKSPRFSLFAAKKAAREISKLKQQSIEKIEKEAGHRSILIAIGSLWSLIMSVPALIYLNIHWFLSSLSYMFPKTLRNFFVKPKLWEKAVIGFADVIFLLVILFITLIVLLSVCIISGSVFSFSDLTFDIFLRACIAIAF